MSTWNLAWVSALCLASACSTSASPLHAIDLSTVNPGDMAGQTPEDLSSTSSGDMTAKSYTAVTIATMRQGASGNFELKDVVVLAVTPSTKSPRLYVQDSAGGDFSAVGADCSSTSTAHPCPIASAVAAFAVGHQVTLQGTFIKSSATKGGFETFYIDAATDGGVAATMPAPTPLTIADVQRGSNKTANWFQHVVVTLSEPLVMYDWTPKEFVYTGATKCPYQFGFGMIPMSASGSAGAACSGTTSQPTGQVTLSSSEVLVGTDFFSAFKVSSDCRCAAMFTDKVPTATSNLTGTLGGILVYDVPFMSTTGHQYVAPLHATDAALTNTQ